MSVMTPMAKLIRRGRFIYTEDMGGQLELVAVAETVEKANWIFGPLSRFHAGVEVVEDDFDPTEVFELGEMDVTFVQRVKGGLFIEGPLRPGSAKGKLTAWVKHVTIADGQVTIVPTASPAI